MSWLKSKISTTASAFILKRVLNKLFKRVDEMDTSWKGVVTVIAIAVIAIAVGFLAGYSTKKVPPPDVVYVDVPITVRDTVLVKVPQVSYVNISAQVSVADPEPVAKDSSSTHTCECPPKPTITAAYLDTLLRSGDEEYGRLMLAYRLPLNVFDLDFYPSPRKEITVTKYIEKGTPWYANPVVMFTAGAAIGISIERMR